MYFLARFDLTLQLSDNEITIKNGEIVFLEEVYNSDVFVKSRDKHIDSYTFNLDECLSGEHNYVKTIKLADDSCLIELKPKYAFSLDVHKKIIEFEKQMFLIEIYNSNLIKIYSPYQSYTIDKKGFIEFNYEIKMIGKKVLFLCFKFETENYYCIFDDSKLIYEGVLKEINIKDNHLTLLNDDISCYGQKRVLDFNLKDNTCDTYFVYGDDREVYKDIDNTYLFLDAVKIKNYSLCKAYLSNELCEFGEEVLFEFFGDFDNYIFIEKSYVLEKNNEVTKVIHFEVLNDIIVNLYD